MLILEDSFALIGLMIARQYFQINNGEGQINVWNLNKLILEDFYYFEIQ